MVDFWNAAQINEAVNNGSIGGGSDLPEVSASDNGDVLTVVNGEWDKATPSTGNINYSTTEQDTGIKWTDGKSIYQKTYSGTTTGTRTEIDDFTDNLLDIKGNLALNYLGDDYVFTVPGYPGDQNPLRFVPFVIEDKLYIDASSGATYNITVYYTKNS